MHVAQVHFLGGILSGGIMSGGIKSGGIMSGGILSYTLIERVFETSTQHLGNDWCKQE